MWLTLWIGITIYSLLFYVIQRIIIVQSVSAIKPDHFQVSPTKTTASSAAYPYWPSATEAAKKGHGLIAGKGHYVPATIANSCVSLIQASATLTCGLIVIWHTRHNPLRAEHWLARTWPWAMQCYTIYDMGSMFYCFRLTTGKGLKEFIRNDMDILIHHLGIIFLAFPLIMWNRDGGDFYASYPAVVEFSSIFILLRQILLDLSMKQTIWYDLNAWLMAGSWFISRIVALPYALVIHAHDVRATDSYWRIFCRIPIPYSFAYSLLWFLSVYWMILIAIGLYRRFYARKKTV